MKITRLDAKKFEKAFDTSAFRYTKLSNLLEAVAKYIDRGFDADERDDEGNNLYVIEAMTGGVFVIKYNTKNDEIVAIWFEQ